MKAKIPILIGMIVIEVVIAFFVIRMVILNDAFFEKKEKKIEKEAEIKVESIAIGELVVNPRGGKGRKFFIIDATVLYDVSKKEIPVTFEKNKLIIVDSLLSVMMSHDVDELQTFEGREKLKGDMIAAINSIIGDKIERLLFQKFLVQ